MSMGQTDVKLRRNSLRPHRAGSLTIGEKVFNVANYTFFILFMLLCVYPFYYIFINTISDNTLSAKGLILFWPQGIHIDNYLQVLKIPNIYQALLISASRTILGTFLTVLVSAFLGFMMTQRKMWLRKYVYRYFITTMYISGGIIPVYLLYNQLGLLNNFLVYILPGMVSAYNMILVKTYVESSVPDELQESAEMDGAGIGIVFFRIVLPLMLPILATLAIFSAVGQWNNFMDTVLYVTNDDLHTLQYVLYRYLSQATALANAVNSGSMSAEDVGASIQTAESIKLTVTMIVVIPIFMVYPFFQRFFVKGIMIGAVKG
ncbi:carbohydrate ABC transporter permease [Paenibacillus xylanexedens]|uniref:carbohydrate ABC transporter permease n=1 Tax=Paenibacillus xylanexedens TaxID=528191 RepID=UPI001C9313C8|nr:carbohydrate ABC transporter permease [Paenibacillus xylanexedens]